MEHKESPLKKYRRQPKLYMTLPSQGFWYDDSIVNNAVYSDLAVFSMTASDEIGFKTPDALINGHATANNIKSCIPAILDPWNVVQIDIDAILISIRMATYGENMSVEHKCSKCSTTSAYDINLQKFLDFLNNQKFKDKIYIDDSMTIHLKPLTYRQWTEVQKKTVALQRALYLNSDKFDNEEKKNEYIQTLVEQLNQITVQGVLDQISSIEVDGEIENNKDEIIDFMHHADVSIYKKITKTITENSENWTLPTVNVECEKCQTTNHLKVTLDSSDFFVSG